MSSRFNDLLRKAQGAISNLRGGSSFFLGRNGEVIYSKNNVCVHESTPPGPTNSEQGPTHTPGYLSIHCLDDEQLGFTLVLQWLPNTLLQKNPTSIRCVSPRPIDVFDQIGLSSNSGLIVKKISCSNRAPRINSEEEEEEEQGSSTMTGGGTEPTMADQQQPLLIDSKASKAICIELNGENGCFLPSTKFGIGDQRPNTLMATTNCGQGLSIPEINLIPNTPIDHLDTLEENVREKSESSGATSGEDEEEEEEEDGDERPISSADDEGEADLDTSDVENLAKAKSQSLEALRQHYAASLTFGSIPEQFALEHNLVLKGEEGKIDEEGDGNESARLAMTKERVQFAKSNEMSSIVGESTSSNREKIKSNGGIGDGGGEGRAGLCTLFSVNLGKMRSIRVFYSDTERTSGQLVIASPDSQYKIFHFHHAGLDKLAALFERWNAVKSKSAGNDSPSAMGPNRHLMICPDDGDLARTELDPEDGLYEQLSWELWRSYISQDGTVEDSFTIRKTIFFASMDPSLRKEVWPFLLRIFPWCSSHEQRDVIRNDLFLRYQRLKRNRIRRVAKGTAIGETFYSNVESSIYKDVIRTDRQNSYFAGEENANLEIMESILMTYAIRYPEINYIQGMSDLLAPLLYTLRDETLAYWCFSALMKLTLFCQSSDGRRSIMEMQLDYLKELLRLFTPEFFTLLEQIDGDAPNLMFVHRWILLFFKREFPPKDALHIWEACWARYRSAHFHLFIACAIVSVFGPDVVAQKLPHDEILLYFSSLAMHMDARLILRKARGLLYQFHRLPKIPCTLAGLLEDEIHSDQWNSHISVQREFECIQQHDGGICPFANISEI